MADNNNKKGRNPFATALSYGPLLGAVGMGVWSVYDDIQANKANVGTAAIDAARRAGKSIRGQRFTARAAAESVLDGRAMLRDSLGGSFGPDSAKRLAFAYAAAIADPAVSLNKQNMLESLYQAQSLAQRAMGANGDKTSYLNHMNTLINNMSRDDANVLWKKWQMLSPSNLGGMSGSILKGVVGPKGADPVGAWVPMRDNRFYQNMGFLSHGKDQVVPDYFKRISYTRGAVNRFLDKRELHGLGLKVNMSVLTARDGSQYQELNVKFRGSKREFRFILGTPGAGVGTGARVVSPKGMSVFDMGYDFGETRSVNEQIIEQIKAMAGQSGADRSRTYRKFYEGLRQRGQFIPIGAGPGQLLRSAIARNTVWDPEARVSGQHYDSKLMGQFMEANANMEAIAPGTLTKGGFIDMANFQNGQKSYDLRNLFKDQHSFNREVRIFQFMRDLNWSPTQLAAAKWGIKGPSDLRNVQKLSAIRMGPGDVLQRFIPVFATKTWKEMLVKDFGYITPGSLTVHLLGDDSPDSQMSKMLSSWGLFDGSSGIREGFAEMLGSERALSYDIMATPGSPMSLPISKEANALLQEGKLTPEMIAEDLRARIAATKGGITLQPNQALGLGTGVKSGKLVRTVNVPDVLEKLVDVTLSHEGYLRLHVKQYTDKLIDTAKFFGSTKTTGNIWSEKTMKGHLRQIEKMWNIADQSLSRIAIDQITATSMIGKTLFHVHEQMISGLGIVAGMAQTDLSSDFEARKWRRARDMSNALAPLNTKIARLEANLARTSPGRLKASRDLRNALDLFSRELSHSISEYDVNATWSKDKYGNYSTDSVPTSKKTRRVFSMPSKDLRRAEASLARARKAMAEFSDIASRDALDQLYEQVNQILSTPEIAKPAQLQAIEDWMGKRGGLGRLYQVGARSKGGIPQAVATAAKTMGLQNHPLIKGVFGGMHYFLSKTGGDVAGYTSMVNRIMGADVSTPMADPITGKAVYMALGQTFNYQGDFPHLAQGRMGSVEARNLDMLLSRQIMVGGENLTEALIRDIYGATSSPTAVKDYNAVSRMLWSMTGDATPTAGLPRVQLNTQNLSDITQEEWFKGQGAVIQFPKEMHEALRAQGLATEWEIIGQRGLSETFGLESEIRSAGYARTQSGDLQAKAYSSQVKKMFELLSPDSFHKNVSLDDRLTAIAMGSKDMNITGVMGLWRTAKKGLIRNKLGPGSSYAQAQGMPAITDILKTQMSGDPWGIGKGVGKELADGNTIFISKRLATRLLDEMSGAGMSLPGTDKEFRARFLGGKESWYGIVGRMPAAYQSSIQSTRIRVYQGGSTDSIENIRVAQNLVDVMINGVSKKMNLGLGPGMGLDFDKDMLFVKMLTDRDGVRIMSEPGNMGKIARQAQFIQVWQDFANTEVVSKMTQHVQSRALEQELPRIEQTKKLFHSKDIGRISKALEEVKYAFLTEDMDELRRSKLFGMLSAVEEAATLKSRKLPYAVNLGQEVVEALYGSGGARTMDPERFVGAIERMFVSDAMREGIEIGIGGETQRIAWTAEDKAAIVKILNTYKNETGGIRRNVFALSRTGRSLSLQEAVGAARFAMKNSMAGEDQLAQLVSDINFKRGFRGIAEEMINKLNIDTKQLGKYSKKMGRYGATGLVGTALMQSFMGGPGYSATPLEGESGLDPRLLEHVQEGSMLNMPSTPPTPQGVAPQQMAPRSGAIHAPTARIIGAGTTARTRVRGDQGAAQLDQAISEYRRRRPGANIRTRIMDNRRPLYPSQIDQY